MRVPRPPIILTGMHRSGTSLVSRALERLGLLVGWWKLPEHESKLFVMLNDWLLRQAGCDWASPRPFIECLESSTPRAFLTDRVRRVVDSPLGVLHLGVGRFLRYRSLRHPTEPWGWKDPRNCVTLPIWLDVFPDARIVHIIRHGVDVAQSLYTRHKKQMSDLERDETRRRLPAWMRTFHCRFANALHCRTRDDAFELWETYVTQATRTVATRAPDQTLTVRYEELLEHPALHLGRLAEFCHVDADGSTVEVVSRWFDPSRRFAYRRDDELRAFADARADRLRVVGY